MTTSSGAAVAGVPPLETARLRLVWLSPEALDAALAADTGRLNDLLGATAPDRWRAASAGVFRLRLDQMRLQPWWGDWLLRAVVLREARAVVGHVGFHGPPGVNALGAADAVEIGYATEPEYRRRGFARESAVALMEWAAGAKGVRRFLASVAPANLPSLALVAQLGFREVARVRDGEDGEEVVFELRR